MKRKRIPVWTVRFKAGWGWLVNCGGRISSIYTSKRAALRGVREKWQAACEMPVSVRIYRKDGRLQKDGERTYPRSADPRSKL